MDFWNQKYGKLVFCKELFYVLGALFGDGCIYKWKKEHQVWLIGDEKFVEKYADKLSLIINRKVRFYEKRKRNYWFVKVSNINLYSLFRDSRNDYSFLLELLQKGNFEENSLQFIEGFFDAEGCVKIISESVRKTPKICLDIANTNLELLDLVRKFIFDNFGFTPNISKQIDKRANRKVMYHVRIYKKDFVRRFLDKVKTTKLKQEKIPFVEKWLNNGK